MLARQLNSHNFSAILSLRRASITCALSNQGSHGFGLSFFAPLRHAANADGHGCPKPAAGLLVGRAWLVWRQGRACQCSSNRSACRDCRVCRQLLLNADHVVRDARSKKAPFPFSDWMGCWLSKKLALWLGLLEIAVSYVQWACSPL